LFASNSFVDSLAHSLTVFFVLRASAVASERNAFFSDCQTIAGSIKNQLNTAQAVLNGFAALIAATDERNLTRAEFNRYYQEMTSWDPYPFGLLTITFARMLHGDAQRLAWERQQNVTMFDLESVPAPVSVPTPYGQQLYLAVELVPNAQFTGEELVLCVHSALPSHSSIYFCMCCMCMNRHQRICAARRVGRIQRSEVELACEQSAAAAGGGADRKRRANAHSRVPQSANHPERACHGQSRSARNHTPAKRNRCGQRRLFRTGLVRARCAAVADAQYAAHFV
jgi:hypothetical protein